MCVSDKKLCYFCHDLGRTRTDAVPSENVFFSPPPPTKKNTPKKHVFIKGSNDPEIYVQSGPFEADNLILKNIKFGSKMCARL